MTPFGLLLAADTVTLYPPAASADEHGWAEAGDSPYWTGTGNLQLYPGTSDPRDRQGGGHGPFGPRAVPAGLLYLPPDCPLAEGSAAEIRGSRWAVSQAREVMDPTAQPGDGIACWVAVATAAPQWQEAGDG